VEEEGRKNVGQIKPSCDSGPAKKDPKEIAEKRYGAIAETDTENSESEK